MSPGFSAAMVVAPSVAIGAMLAHFAGGAWPIMIGAGVGLGFCVVLDWVMSRQS